METKFNFKSQVCTDKIQSERLLSLGLKKETADMVHEPHYVNGLLRDYFKPKILVERVLEYMLTDEGFYEYIPAWSLHRLIEMVDDECVIYLDNFTIAGRLFEVYDNLFDNIIDCIEWLIKEGCFNKEYLV
jgi:hypothetical protein